MKFLIAKKVGMGSVMTDEARLEPLTLLAYVAPVVTQIKTRERDGYDAVQIAALNKGRVNKPLQGHLAAAKTNLGHLREVRLVPGEQVPAIGEPLPVDALGVGDLVNVTGTSKGKGFAGTIKRHNFKRGRKTHGGRSYRRPGSIGSMYPQKIFKGKRMAGRMGGHRVTVRNLRISLIDHGRGLLGLRGAVPGPNNGLVVIKGSHD